MVSLKTFIGKYFQLIIKMELYLIQSLDPKQKILFRKVQHILLVFTQNIILYEERVIYNQGRSIFNYIGHKGTV